MKLKGLDGGLFLKNKDMFSKSFFSLVAIVSPIEILIGTQVWKSKNVNNNITGSKVYDDDENNRVIYGGLYDWSMIAAIEAANPGWHVPTQAEFQTLIDYLGGDTVAGGHLKETGISHWINPNIYADNSSGFTARPSGVSVEGYSDIGLAVEYWTKDPVLPNFGRYMGLYGYEDNDIFVYNNQYDDKSHFLSVRLIKD
jgi:uncharacterized protein (TIGR02145 family)